MFDDGKVPGFQLEVSGDGSTDAKKIELEPGKYVFYCDIIGHRAQGMEGTLTVKWLTTRSAPGTASSRAGSGPTRSPLAHSSGGVERLGHLDRDAACRGAS